MYPPPITYKGYVSALFTNSTTCGINGTRLVMCGIF